MFATVVTLIILLAPLMLPITLDLYDDLHSFITRKERQALAEKRNAIYQARWDNRRALYGMREN